MQTAPGPSLQAPELIGRLKHPHSDSVSSAASEDMPTSAGAGQQNEIFEMSMSSSRKSASLEVSSDPANSEPTTSPLLATASPDPVNSKPASESQQKVNRDLLTPEPRPPVDTPDPAEGGQRMSRVVQRGESKRLSKKEKRFQLSKDDGQYAELNPINPHQAQKEFGGKLRLNPVGPAFGGVASAEVITSHNTSAVPGLEGSEFMCGRKYVVQHDIPPGN